jgi:hypothetical protein
LENGKCHSASHVTPTMPEVPLCGSPFEVDSDSERASSSSSNVLEKELAIVPNSALVGLAFARLR